MSYRCFGLLIRSLLFLAGLAVEAIGQSPQPDARPRLLSKNEAEYTEEARRAIVNTRLSVAFTVGVDGVPQDIHVVRTAGFGLDEKAVQAVMTWRFEPGRRQGAAVPMKATAEVNYRLFDAEHQD